MGYRLFRRHRQHFWAERILDRLEPTGLIIEVAEIVVHEADEPNLFTDLLDPHVLARERPAEVNLSSRVADAAAPGDGDGPIMARIVQLA